jgi:hypothetical protein
MVKKPICDATATSVRELPVSQCHREAALSDDLTRHQNSYSRPNCFEYHRDIDGLVSPSFAVQHICCFGVDAKSDRHSSSTTGSIHVNLALRLNVLAVYAVFAFVGAVLLGAF